MSATNDAGSSLRDVVNGKADLHVNAYVESPRLTRFGVPYLLHYTGTARPYGLAIGLFVPASTHFTRISLTTVTVETNGRSETHTINQTGTLSEFEASDGPLMTTTIRCGLLVSEVGQVKLVVRGTLHSGDDLLPFSRTLHFDVHESTYVYPGWSFIFLPMSA